MLTRGTLLDGKYRLIYRIASGGMGEVWKARVELPGGEKRDCAIKFIRSDLPVDADRVDLLTREAVTGYDVTGHPYLVTTRDLGHSPVGPYLVTELVDGPNLTQAADELHDQYPILRAIARASLLALYDIHQSGRIHSDVSPNNILIGRTGQIKLTDFGLTRHQDSQPTGHILGTVAFVSREEIELGRAYPQSDLYSLGAVLYELVTGDSPYGSTTIWHVEQRINQGPPDPLPDDLPTDLATLIPGLMAHSLENRLTIPQALDLLHDSGEPIAGPDEVTAFVENWLAHHQWEPPDAADPTANPSEAAATPAANPEEATTEPIRAPSLPEPPPDRQTPSELVEVELLTGTDPADLPDQLAETQSPAPAPDAPAEHLQAEQLPVAPDPSTRPTAASAQRPRRALGVLAAAAVLAVIASYGLWHRSTERPLVESYPEQYQAPDDLGLAKLDLPRIVVSSPQPVPAENHATRLAEHGARPSVGPDPVRTARPSADATSKRSTNAHRTRGTAGTGRPARRNDVESYSWYQVPADGGDLPATIGVELLSRADR